MVEVREYLDRNGRSPYASWFNRLNREAAAKVAAALARIQQGNLSNTRALALASMNTALISVQATGSISEGMASV